MLHNSVKVEREEPYMMHGHNGRLFFSLQQGATAPQQFIPNKRYAMKHTQCPRPFNVWLEAAADGAYAPLQIKLPKT